MASTLDFRFLDEGLGGERSRKRRRDEEEEAAAATDIMDLDLNADTEAENHQRPSKLAAMASLADPSKPASLGQPTYSGVIAGRVSGRRWKQPRTQRASATLGYRPSKPYEQRVKEKEIKKAYKSRMDELKEEIRSNKVEKRKKREEREKRKQENVLKSGTKLQKVTNPKTLKKIAKSKQRKQLKVVPDEVLDRRAGEKKRKEALGDMI